MRGALFAICVAALPAAGAERRPLQNDFDRCTLAMVNSSATGDMQGSIRMELLIRKVRKRRDGEAHAAIDRLVEHELVVRQSTAAPPAA